MGENQHDNPESPAFYPGAQNTMARLFDKRSKKDCTLTCCDMPVTPFSSGRIR